MHSHEGPSVASRAVGAGAWTVGTRLLAKLIDLAMLLCLARFLGPAEFGLVAMAMAAVFIIEALFDLPTAAALIRLPELEPDMLHTAFTLSLLRGVVVGLLLIAVAWPLAAFNNEPRVALLMVVLALAPAMRGLVNPRMVEYARALNFRPDALLELSGKVVAFVVAVSIAAATRSFWAIAAATVCAPLVSTVLSYVIAPIRPRLRLTHWPQFSSLIGWNFVSQWFSALNWQIDRLVLPRVTDAGAFGQYTMGRQLAEVPSQVLIQPLVRPVMPTLASAGDARQSRYLKLSHAIAVVMLPVMGLPLLWPEPLVRVALGPAWSGAAQWLLWISAITVIGLPGLLLAPLAMTLDRTRWLAFRTTVEFLVRLPLVWIGAVHYGILGAVAASAVASAVGMVVGLFVVRHLIATSLAAQLMTLLRPVLAMVPAAGFLWWTKPWVMGAPGLIDLLLRAVPLGLLYLFIYMLATLVAWQLAGRPGGLEQHLVGVVRTRVQKPLSRRARTSGRSRPHPRHPKEAHVEQPH
ncbi:oligosaccharide flippase family protein [Variovorax dokdonensis]|uniref:Oligosaccharide flippase family protein n=1 Tax=Variovorax dokdonensis TaxID=344883 RepID=A0ABT7N5W9_9BURK|nr:oligosaccharide flippase family protein [Variovorax dokdonensis]